MRKMAYIAEISTVSAIPKANKIELISIGGWNVVVPKASKFQLGEKVVYIELDAFFPSGVSAWQFLVDRQPTTYMGQIGYVLKTISLQGQYSQGFVVRLSDVGLSDTLPIGHDVSSILGICKYDPPLSADMVGIARGNYPGYIPKTDQERLQNLFPQFNWWRQEGSEWEISEKLEGQSSTFAWIEQDLHACSRRVDFLKNPDNTLWKLADRYGMEESFLRILRKRMLAFQGELIGPEVEGNIYKMSEHDFYVFDIYDLQSGNFLESEERLDLCAELGLKHAPILDRRWKIPQDMTAQELIRMADGPSMLKTDQNREGKVYKRKDGKVSFKTISDLYLKPKA